jgi:ligand-binding sensor domain-containing protein/DNA-binding CsgD family transcriptional regulator
MHKYLVIGLILFCVKTQGLLATDLNPSYSFTTINKNDGLADNNVSCVFKDSDGFIWFGTRNGLCRFDGYEFRVFRKENHPGSISGNRILDICEDNQGNLWVGTYNDGLNKFDKKQEIFTHYNEAHGIGNRINRIKTLKDGRVWICSNQGLAYYLPDSDQFFAYQANKENSATLLSNHVYDIIETKNGSVYVAPESNELQLLNLETNTFETIAYKRDPELQNNYKKYIVEGKDGLLWISANYHGLCSYNPETGRSEVFTKETKSLSTNVLMGDMAIDNTGNIWICTEGDGINIFNPNTKTYQQLKYQKGNPEALNSDHTYTVYFDDNNIAWIGTYDKGINKSDPYQQKFHASLYQANDLTILNGLSILDIFEDSKKRIWFGTDGYGLYCFEKGNSTKHYMHTDQNSANGLTSNIITAISEDKHGNILIGTYAGGLLVFNPETETSISYMSEKNNSSGLSSSNIWEILTDSRKTVWLGLLGTGVDEFISDSGIFIKHGPSSSDNNKIEFPNIMVILEDTDGDLWFGSEGKGLFILDNQSRKIQRIPHDSVYHITTEGIIKSLLQDQWGHLWIGTEDAGLFKFNKKTKQITRIGEKENMQALSIQSIQEDNMGNIWIGTSNGLYRHNPKNNNFIQFVTDDGLSSNEINQDAMIKLNDGRLIVGTRNGADLIIPEKVLLNQTLPKIIFTRLTILNNDIYPKTKINKRVVTDTSITYLKELELNWKDKIFTLEFAALNYTLPHKCEYQYRLDGFDENWVNTPSTRRIASYSNLKPGKYIFRVKASNNDGKWGNNETSIAILVKPPFWNTLVFKLFLAVLLLTIAYVVYKYRINVHKERFRQRQMEQERKIISLENEKLESELKKLAFSVINKNKLLIEHKNKLLTLSNKARVSVKEGLQKIVESIDEDLNEEKDWKTIEPQIDKAYNQFVTKLKEQHPDLTASEIRIAAYIRMNLSTKEICEFMNKTQRAVENDRYRLRKKIGLESNDSIQNYLLKL